MSESDFDKVEEIKNKIWKEVHDLVDANLVNTSPEIEEMIREQLTEQFRFWRRL